MWPDRVSNPGPLTYESGALPTALRGLAKTERKKEKERKKQTKYKIVLEFINCKVKAIAQIYFFMQVQ